MNVLVTGATGFVGRALVNHLAARGFTVHAMGRNPNRIEWPAGVRPFAADATDPDQVRQALDGIEVAYYLLHSMESGGDFETRDKELAEIFGNAAKQAGVHRIVYLSGLHPNGELSPHLRSRVEVGRILLGSGVPTAVLQAGVVLGKGSVSFEMLRHLSERLPLVVAPKWLRHRIQPIALPDVLHYLERAAALAEEVNRTFDIGGPDVLTYAEMMQRYAEVAGLGARHIATVPVLTPWLASHWIGLVTPVNANVAKPLVGSLIHEAVCSEHDLRDLVGPPPGGEMPFADAIRAALAGTDPKRWRRTLGQTAAMTGLAAVVGSVLTRPDTRWYARLRKPTWQPPAAAFPVVWSGLYATIALSAAATIAELTEQDKPEAAAKFTRALGLNLILNAAWSGVFFRGHALRTATVLAAALAASSADLGRRAAQTGRPKAVELGAYAAWCTFATALTGWIASHND